MKKKQRLGKKGSSGNNFFIWLPWASWNESTEDPPIWPAEKCESLLSTKEKRLMFMTSVSGAVRRGMTSLFLNNPIELKKSVLCCCVSRALVVGSWLMQSERNTTGFTSGPLWQAQKGWSQHLIRCYRGKRVKGWMSIYRRHYYHLVSHPLPV